jgi:thymidylate synthase
MKSYLELVQTVLDQGSWQDNRTGTRTISLPGAMLRFDLQQGFPAVTTKKLAFKSAIGELVGFLRGIRNAADFRALGCQVWNQNANENASWLANPYRNGEDDLGPVYGVQWRSWPTPDGGHIDQIAEVVKQLKANPDSRRIIVSAWNVAELSKMALMPCHAFFQFYVADGRLSCQLYQRSADIFLGVPFNIASYALLTHMLAQQCDLKVGDFIWTGGDCHIYSNHTEQVELQLSRSPYPYPTLHIKRRPDSIFDYQYEDFEVLDYQCHPAIKAPVAV